MTDAIWNGWPLTVDKHRALMMSGLHLRVFVRGEDVTDRCYFADDTPGAEIARLFALNADGRKYVVDDEVATECVQGDVVIKPQQEAMK